MNPTETHLTRAAAAHMLYNALLVEEIKYEKNKDESSGLLYVRGQGTMLMNRFGVTRVTGVAAANDKKSVDASAYKTTKAGVGRVSVSALSGLAEVSAALKDNPVFPVTLSDDLLGQTIVILVKFTDNAADGAAVVGGPILAGSGEPA